MFALRCVQSVARPVQALARSAAASASAAAAAAAWSAASLSPLRAAVCLARPVPGLVATPARHSSNTATSFRHKKQKEWRIRAGRGFAALKTHSGCKKRFRFISRYGVVCKHAGKHHKNFNKHSSRLARLRKMKLVPRAIVKKLKVMMPYWRRQMRKERTLLWMQTEPSVTRPSQISLERQRAFIQAQQERMTQQLLDPKPYFPRITAPVASTPVAAAKPKQAARA